MVVEKIIYYKERGFVFHGSINDEITILKPNKPNDAGNDPWNKDVAVYATENPVYAIIFALHKGYRGIFNVNTNKEGRAVSIFNAWFEKQIQENRGYVYILEDNFFTERKGFQCKSFREVKPTEIIEVTIEDYISLGGLLEFV